MATNTSDLVDVIQLAQSNSTGNPVISQLILKLVREHKAMEERLTESEEVHRSRGHLVWSATGEQVGKP